jgi:hypothetical protein
MSAKPTEYAASANRTHLILRVVILVLLAFIITRLSSGDLSSRISAGDFVEYWAGSRILVRGGNPYNATALLPFERSVGWTGSEALVPFNPPWAFLPVLPFSLLPFWLARIAWFVFNLVLLIGIADWIWRINDGNPRLRWAGWLCAILFIPAAIALHLGQMSILVLAGVIGFLFANEHKHGFIAGCCTLLATTKPHVIALFWLILLLWVLKKRRWDVLSGAVVSFAFALAASLIFYPSAYQFYLEALRSEVGPSIWQTPTWGVILRDLFPHWGGWLYYLPAAIGIIAGVALWARWHANFVWEERLPSILLVSTITAAYAWTFDWVVLLPVLIPIVIRCLKTQFCQLIFAALVSVQLILIVQSIMQVSNLYSIWLPPALATLYWLSGRAVVSIERSG